MCPRDRSDARTPDREYRWCLQVDTQPCAYGANIRLPATACCALCVLQRCSRLQDRPHAQVIITADTMSRSLKREDPAVFVEDPQRRLSLTTQFHTRDAASDEDEPTSLMRMRSHCP
jgi:hypothetical protein